MKGLKNKSNLVELLPIALLLIALIAGLVICRVTSLDYRTGLRDFFMTIDDADHRAETIDGYQGYAVTYSFELPESEIEQQDLLFYVKHAYTTIRVDGRVRYRMQETSKPHIGHTPGHYWVTMPLQEEDKGKSVEITVVPVYKNYSDNLPRIFITSIHYVLSTFLYREFPQFLLSLTAFLTGLILIIMMVLAGNTAQNSVRLLYMGLMTSFTGLWKLCGVSFLPLFLSTLFSMEAGRVVYYIGIIAFFLIPPMCMRFLYHQQLGAHPRLLGWMSIGATAVSAAILLMQLGGMLEYHDATTFVMAEIVVMLLLSLMDAVGNQKALLWIFPFAFVTILDLIIQGGLGNPEQANFFLIWMLLHAFVRGTLFLRESLEQERKLREQSEELRDAKLGVLMSQIRPHFIHNTLASAYYLCEDDPAKAQRVIRSFMDYLQGNYMALSNPDMIPFNEELKHVKSYVAVEKVRFEGELEVLFDTPWTEFRVPPLTLQPLVENAVKYGVGRGISPGTVVIRTRRTFWNSEILIEDNGIGYDPESLKTGVHTGLKNVRTRLESMCGGSVSIEAKKKGPGTIVKVLIPHPDTENTPPRPPEIDK